MELVWDIFITWSEDHGFKYIDIQNLLICSRFLHNYSIILDTSNIRRCGFCFRIFIRQLKREGKFLEAVASTACPKCFNFYVNMSQRNAVGASTRKKAVTTARIKQRKHNFSKTSEYHNWVKKHIPIPRGFLDLPSIDDRIQIYKLRREINKRRKYNRPDKNNISIDLSKYLEYKMNGRDGY